MKAFIFFARVGMIILLSFNLQPASGSSENAKSKLSLAFPNYVVIGAFAHHQNAVKFTNEAMAARFDAHFDINPNRNLFYVYVLTTEDHDLAINEAKRLRKETKYKDAWVYNGIIGKATGPVLAESKDINPETQESIQSVESEEKITEPPKEEITSTNTSIQLTKTEPETASTTEQKPPVDKTITPENIKSKNFVFELYRASDNTRVEGNVEVAEKHKAKRLGLYKGNTPVKIAVPNTKSGDVVFFCEIFGYRPLQKDFSFANPAASGFEVNDDGNVVVPFDLVRLQKGDIAVMYNVFFYIDAAIMKPDSKLEVDKLLELLNENPNYKIKIHGHTNGNAHGKIIRMGESKNFFALTDTEEGFGSARQLSEERANTIREFLIASGIDASRMSVKAWGGKRPIFDKHSQRAHENVRVEVEILQH
jgi:outer membrane protein OmpA-like peptidoglycan-associated protein